MCTSTIAHRPRPAPPATQVAGDRQPQRRHLGGLRAWALDGSEPEDQTCRSSFTGIRGGPLVELLLRPIQRARTAHASPGTPCSRRFEDGRVRLSSTISGKGPRTKSCNATSGIATTHHASERTPMTDTVHHPTPALSHLRKKLPSCALEALEDLGPTVFGKGALDRRTRHLVAAAVAHAIQCPNCVRGHIRLAIDEGASAEQIGESIWVAAEVAAGGVYAHAALGWEVLNSENCGSANDALIDRG